MNHLANLYLSRNQGYKMLGCLIGEIVRTSNQDKYNHDIIEGIEINKQIIQFIKNHPAYENSKQRLNTRYSKYSYKIISIFYDHLLADNWSKYCDIELENFADICYEFIQLNYNVLPYKIRKIVNVMIQNNWLVSYKSIQGIHAYMREITRRDTFQTNLEYSLEDLINNYSGFRKDFDVLFPELEAYCEKLFKSENIMLQAG